MKSGGQCGRGARDLGAVPGASLRLIAVRQSGEPVYRVGTKGLAGAPNAEALYRSAVLSEMAKAPDRFWLS